MPDTKELKALKATSLLKEDHKKVKKLFAQFDHLEAEDSEALSALYEEVRKELQVHAQIEEEIFYPEVNKAQDKEAKELILEAHEEHKIVKTLLEELSGMTAEDPAFHAKMKVLKESVLHHAGEEEKEIFPIFSKLDKNIQEEISHRLNNRKRELAFDDKD